MSEPREIKIDLTDNYRLIYDFCGNKFLQKKAVSKNGKVAYPCYCGYFPTFEMLLEEFCNHRIADCEATTIKTALKQFSNAETEMRKLAREAGRKLDKKAVYEIETMFAVSNKTAKELLEYILNE